MDLACDDSGITTPLTLAAALPLKLACLQIKNPQRFVAMPGTLDSFCADDCITQ